MNPEVEAQKISQSQQREDQTRAFQDWVVQSRHDAHAEVLKHEGLARDLAPFAQLAFRNRKATVNDTMILAEYATHSLREQYNRDLLGLLDLFYQECLERVSPDTLNFSQKHRVEFQALWGLFVQALDKEEVEV